MQIKDRQKLLLIVAIAVLGILLGDWFVFTPLTTSWSNRSQRIHDLQAKVHDGDTLIRFQRSIEGGWDRMRTNALPNNVSAAEGQMFKSFDRWERYSGIARLSLKPQWRQNEDEYATLECRADYAGDMDRLTRFLYDVERDPTGLKVDSVEISSRDDAGRQMSLGLQVSGLMLVSPATNAAPKL